MISKEMIWEKEIKILLMTRPVGHCFDMSS
jgi:hypothetical protein